MNFTITTEPEGPIAVISLTGEVDLYTAPEFKAELVKVIEGWAEHVVVDLSDTTFIDSTTLGVLISGVKRLRPRNGRLALVITDRNIRKIFDITGLDRVFPIFEERERALADLRSAAGDLPRRD
jgi:anti-sigma B factor antagonist